MPQATVLRLSGMQIGKPVDKTAIEAACKRLADTGLFGTVNYKYGPGPKQGYAVTLELTDQPATLPAVIDIPGADEDAAWQWLRTQYPTFVRKVAESSQDFLAKEIQQHLASVLGGEPVVARSESDLKTRKMLVIFQPQPCRRSVRLHSSVFRSSGRMSWLPGCKRRWAPKDTASAASECSSTALCSKPMRSTGCTREI